MIVLKILGIVLAVILGIIALILMLPAHILVSVSPQGEVKLLYRVLFLTFGRHPNPNSLVVRIAKDLTGISHMSDLGAVRSTVDRNGLGATLREYIHILGLLLGRVLWILKYCTLGVLQVHVVCAGEDPGQAAMEYGTVCALVYPFLGWLQNQMKVREKGTDVQVQCDFTQSRSSVRVQARISIRIWYVFLALLHIIRRNVEEEIYKEAPNE